uniref:Leucine zipper tumor suppressor 1 n=1 Tax=Lepisosteus oculatus TaxID=7918 RepID=W5NCK0_LEPOC|nr:PREDICTED: leucine zipper putative tumor suppressor 1 isoform X1 [Lepisosteus oculatus]XP_015194049.1 PREDICTED: leucine zipper putative tumor suppressor 1 isoform X1 [Lepisosteus oculatus]XP_015194672.1 PREDICTED: leucine zipper putative tumor suppressor 1 isoform X1 [Lepisosteus oculatus]
MGSVSSLISGHSLHSKHCRATEYKLRKTPQAKKTRRDADGLLRYGFAQDSANNNTKAVSQAGRSEDFFYIKVSHKPRAAPKCQGARPTIVAEDPKGPAGTEPGNITPPRLVPFSGKLEKGTEKGLIRPTAFKPVIPRNSNSTESHNNLNHIISKRLSPAETANGPEPKPDNNSGTLSDSGRNSMSSLPTHSTSGSCQIDNISSCPQGPQIRCGVSAQNTSPSQNGGSSGRAHSCSVANNKAAPSSETGPRPQGRDGTPPEQAAFSDSAACVRSPISTDETLIQQLEQRLLERETELQELQVSFEEKEVDTCQLFEEKQKYCKEEMEGLKQRCSTKLRQVSQRAVRAQQTLQLQVLQLQQEKKQLQDDVMHLTQERDLLEVKLKSYEKEQTQLAPTLEETQWEVCQKSGEISLLKQQLKESQGDVSHKLNEIVNLKAILRETKSKMEALEQKIKELEETVRARTVEVEVCENELQRKKNEADLLREKVGQLETDIRNMKQDLALAKEEQQRRKSEASVRGLAGQSRGRGQKGGPEDTEALQREVEKLRAELREEKQKKERMASSFQLERLTWNREKEKVIRYQKQLQHNYLQMYKKNQDLEKILKELTVELESRTDLDMDIQSADIHYEDIIATEI